MSIDWNFVYEYQDKDPPWGPIGYITYKRTYARLTEDGTTEEWWQTIHRCVESLINDLEAPLNQEEVEQLYYLCFYLKCCFSGRSLWQLGTSTILKLGADSLQACWQVTVNDPIKPFIFAFDKLMLGGGVGFNILPENVYELPVVPEIPTIYRHNVHDVDFIVPDNREGWVELLHKTLECIFVTGKSLIYSTVCVRSKGAKINAFGGTASGPEELSNGIQTIVSVISKRQGMKLRPIDCLDIMNIIGSVVVAGNVRRSAQVAVGSADDVMFLNSKAFGRGAGVPNWRVMSNNTVTTHDIRSLPKIFWDNYTEVDEFGEAVSEPLGLLNLHNCRRFGRLADGDGYRPDPRVEGCNPCGEIPLESYEACNLFEIFLPNIDDEAEFKNVAELAYKVTKSISMFPFSDSQTNEIVTRNRRLGIGVCGFLQASHLRSEVIFNNVYRHLEELDKHYSSYLGINRSVKLTTVKPSGTLSLIAGVTPGSQGAFAPHYIRRIRFASNDSLIDVCRSHGYHVEPALNLDGSHNMGTSIVSFPVKPRANSVYASDLGAIKQLEYLKWLQTNWADNSVSVTIYYTPEELPDIKAWLDKNYVESIKGVSFLRVTNHGYVQAPMEAISIEQYNKMVSAATPITRIVDHAEIDLKESLECESGVCPTK